MILHRHSLIGRLIRRHLFTLFALLLSWAAQPAWSQSEVHLPQKILREDIMRFIDYMQGTHQFARSDLEQLFANYAANETVLRLIRPPANPSKVRSWRVYRSRFVNAQRIHGGQIFLRRHAEALNRAQAAYGVPKEIITAIIGVETVYGANMGNFSVLDALATLAFDYPPRSALFQTELENLLLLARDNRVSPADYVGSYAGAIGLGQFLPSSLRNFGVDCDGDGRIDLSNSADDAICSVAHYLKANGWQSGQPVALPVTPVGPAQDIAALLAQGLEPRHLPSTLPLRESGTVPEQEAALIEFPTPQSISEYWLGYNNFYVITRYNRSSFYAMSVFQLAQALRQP